MARVIELATNRFGAWSAVTLVDGFQLRRSDSAGADDFVADARPRSTREMPPRAADALYRATLQAATYPLPIPVEVRTALGVPPGSAELLDGPDAVLVTVPLTTTLSGRAVLAVLAARPPRTDELSDFATRASRAITAAAIYEEQATLARTLRDALVPARLPDIDGVQFGAAYRPAQEATQIGGDFYDVTPRPDGTWAISIGDVCGKGVDAAVLTGQVRQSLRTASLVTDDPADALDVVNQTLLRSHGTTYVTALFGVMSRAGDETRIRLASGGHPQPLLLRGDTVGPVPTRGTLVGMLAEASFQSHEVVLRPGDLLLMYTDGLPEARGAQGLLGSEPVLELLRDCAGLTAQAVTERLMQLVLEHLGGWPHDDVALLAVRAVPEART